METKEVILSRGLPKTGSIADAVTGEDGYYQAGWWKGQKIADNRTRFASIAIGSEDVVYDRATGLTWPAYIEDRGCNEGNVLAWAAAITYAEGLTFAGFDDWRIPNINELMSIVDWNPLKYPIDTTYFSYLALFNFWSSTADPTVSTDKLYFNQATHLIDSEDIAGTNHIRCVRGGV